MPFAEQKHADRLEGPRDQLAALCDLFRSNRCYDACARTGGKASSMRPRAQAPVWDAPAHGELGPHVTPIGWRNFILLTRFRHELPRR